MRNTTKREETNQPGEHKKKKLTLTTLINIVLR